MYRKFDDYINESLKDKLKGKSIEEVELAWDEKYEVSYRECLYIQEKLEELGIDVIKLTERGYFMVNAYGIFRSNYGSTKTLLKEEAEEIVNISKKYDFEEHIRYDIKKIEREILYINEAINYLKKKINYKTERTI
jgi:hypothetical protein